MLEIACFNITAAIAAANAGADRIELCNNAAEGGTTPSFGTLKVALDKILIPVFPIIRPRGGDFIYTDDEYAVMLQDIQLCRQLNCAGIVTGILQKDGSIDLARTRHLVQTAAPMDVTFHRAFDQAQNPMQALEDVIATGCKRLLTSGQQATALQGKWLIKELVKQADNRIIIMPGGGVRNTNIRELLEYTGALEYHSSAGKKIPSFKKFNPGNITEYDYYSGVNVAEIQAMKTILANKATAK